MTSTVLLVLLLSLCSLDAVVSLTCHRALTVDVPGNIQPDGNLVAAGHVFKELQFESLGQGLYRVCICDVRKCLRKCCSEGQTFVERKCAESSSTFKPLVYYRDSANSFILLPNYDLSEFQMVYGDTCTNGKYALVPEKNPEDVFHLLTNGTLTIGQNETHDYSTQDFCLEQNTPSTVLSAFICFPETPAIDAILNKVYPIGMIISMPFLLLTLLVYALLADNLSLHRLCVMCHVSSLLVAYIFLCIIQLDKTTPNNPDFCVVAGFIIQFSFLATFFWLNVMSFDTWWTFSGLRGIHRGTVREIEMQRFLLYSLYAWGGPVIMLVVSLVMDLAPNIPDYLLKPQFGKNRCFFETREATLVYFYGPIALIILCNMVFFILTACKIISDKRATKRIMRSSDSRRSGRENEANKQKFLLYLRLFLIMGVNWAMEVVSWAVEKPQWIWYISDVSNCLQGVLIFWICVLNSNMRGTLIKALGRFKRRSNSSNTRTTPLSTN